MLNSSISTDQLYHLVENGVFAHDGIEYTCVLHECPDLLVNIVAMVILKALQNFINFFALYNSVWSSFRDKKNHLHDDDKIDDVCHKASKDTRSAGCQNDCTSVGLKRLSRGSIHIVDPLGEHSPGYYWPYNEPDRVRRTDCYGRDRPSHTCDIRRILDSELA